MILMSSFLRKLETTVTGGAILIAAASLCSRLLGLVRDRLLSSRIGPGDVLDSYYVAFRLPDFIFNILILGAVSSAFIPVFIELWHKHDGSNKDQKGAWNLVNNLLSIFVVSLSVLALLGIVFARQIVPIFAPGFHGEKLVMSVTLTRIMLLSIVFFGISNVLSSILNSLKRFFAFAFAPMFYNIGIILGIIFFYPRLGFAGLAWGVVLGAFLHLLLQLPSVRRLGFRFHWRMRPRQPAVRKVFRLMVPRTIGLGAVQIDQTVSTMIASTLAVGSVSIFSLANNLASVPISLFGISLAIASFPVFSEMLAAQQIGKFALEFSKVFRRILFFTIPVTVLFLLLRAHIVRLILGSGKFGWDDTILTAQSLGFLSLSLFAQSLIPMLARSFYALQDTKTPVKISILAVAMNIAGGLLLGPILGVQGLALSFSIASTVQMFVLLIVLRLRLGDLDDERILFSTMKIILASSAMAFVVWAFLHFLALGINSHKAVGILIQGSGAALAGTLVYIAITMVFRFDEVSLIRQWLERARNQLLGSRKENERS